MYFRWKHVPYHQVDDYEHVWCYVVYQMSKHGTWWKFNSQVWWLRLNYNNNTIKKTPNLSLSFKTSLNDDVIPCCDVIKREFCLYFCCWCTVSPRFMILHLIGYGNLNISWKNKNTYVKYDDKIMKIWKY